MIRRYMGTLTMRDLDGAVYQTEPIYARAESAEGAEHKIIDRLDFAGYARHEWTLSALGLAKGET